MSQNKDTKAAAAPDELHKQLAYLNLPFMREQVEELARQAADKQWSHLGFLGRLVEGEAALRQDRARVRFATAIDIVNTLSTADRTGQLHAELKKYTRPDLLIIDELGYLPIDQHGANLLFQVISGRYECGSMLFTTNKVFKHWSTIFCNDATLTSAILDRIVHHSQTIIIEGKSFRMKDRIEP